MLARIAMAAVTALVFSVPSSAAAAPVKDSVPDLGIQGEYLGKIKTDQGETKVGVQVVALGNGKFRAVAHPGGLPGAGWDPNEEKTVGQGEIKNGLAQFTTEDGQHRGVIQNGVLTITGPEGGTAGALKRINRQSPTMGAKPPAGAIVLFDGRSADRFEGGRLSEDGLLKEGATSKQKFGSFTIHLEFRTPFEPNARGQGRGNSGFYAQGRYEVQILDSFGLEGENNECGGIYSVRKPDVNMCLPPMDWQTYDIDFTAATYKDGKKTANARMTVRHNGVLIHEGVEVPRATTAAPVPEGPQDGPIFLQNHGNPVRFRNIWVLEKK